MSGAGREQERVTILLVDDRASNLVTLQATLDDPSYELVLAGSGPEALAAVLRHDFAVILLDVAMPGMDGFEVATLIKQRDRSSRIPIIFISASIFDATHVFQSYSVGAVDFIQKPIDAFQVRTKVAVFVELYRQRQTLTRQAARLAMHQSQAQYDATVRAAPIGIGQLDSSCRWRRVNPYLCELLGFGEEELLAHRLDDDTHPDDVGAHAGAMPRLLSGELPAYHEQRRLLRNGGEPVWVDLTLAPLPPGDGSATQLVAIVNDITERKQVERAQQMLNEAGALLVSSLDQHQTMDRVAQLAVRHLADWCVIDLQNEERHQVAAAHRDTKKAPLTTSLVRRLEKDGARRQGPAQVFRTGRSELHATVPNLEWMADALDVENADSLRELGARSCLFVPLFAHREVIAVITLVRSERRARYTNADLALAEELARRASMAVENTRLYREAKSAVQAREEMVSIVSHDLKNPLSNIALNADRLVHQVRDPGARKSAERILSGTRNMQRMIRDLLDLASLRGKRLPLELKKERIAPLVEEAVELLEPLAREKSIRLEREAPPRGLEAVCDHDRMLQVFSNLVGNAVKFSPEGSAVSVRAEVDGGELRFVVADSGPGIPEDQQARIFEPFWQGEAHATKGTGLGLYIARGIIEAHGGHLWVESKVGEGTRFYFTLPLEHAARVQAAEEASPAPIPAG